ncbi:MAG: NUDIX domain-containing protein [Croceibacterium sp.]
MLHLIPAPLHRRLYRLADWGRRQWWRVRMPRRSSVNIMAIDDAGRVLLVRHSYGRPLWLLPGGGIGRGEDPAHAAIREFREELGCAITDLQPLETSEEAVSGSIDRQHVFVARLAGTPVPDMREVVAAEVFDPAALPADTGRLSVRRIARWQASQQR